MYLVDIFMFSVHHRTVLYREVIEAHCSSFRRNVRDYRTVSTCIRCGCINTSSNMAGRGGMIDQEVEMVGRLCVNIKYKIFRENVSTDPNALY